MGCNCNEKKYNISMGCCVPVLAPIENYYTKTEVDELIESAITSGSCCITPEEVDEKIASAKTEIEGEIPTVPTSNTAFTNDAGYITGVDLSNYATLDYVNIGDKFVHDEVDGKVQTLSGNVRTISGDVQVANAHLSFIDNVIGTLENGLKAHTADTSIHFTTGAVQTQINNSISGKADYSDIKTYSAGNGIAISTANTISLDVPVYKGSGDTNVSICSTQGMAQGCNNIGGFCSAGIGWGLETQNTGESSIGSFNQTRYEQKPTYGSSGRTCFSVGNGINDGYRHNALEIRENGDIYIPKTSDIIDSGSIEPTGHNHYDCRMVKLQDTVDAVGNLKFVSLSQADYDALVAGGTTDANTIYFIKNS